MSDIHGCYDEFIQMLNKINFGDEDILICAGDYVDRGPKSLEMLRWIMNAPDNVIFVRGNHDEEFAACIDVMKSIYVRHAIETDDKEASKMLYQIIGSYSGANGSKYFDYYGTIGELINVRQVGFAELCVWSERISKMPYFYKTDINERTCVIVHAGYIENLEDADTERTYNSLQDFYLYARDDAYMCGGIPHGMIIAGHTPTIAEEEFPYNDGNIYRMYDEEMDCIFYDIDCGCSMSRMWPNAKLACIRLEDEAYFYVKR